GGGRRASGRGPALGGDPECPAEGRLHLARGGDAGARGRGARTAGRCTGCPAARVSGGMGAQSPPALRRGGRGLCRSQERSPSRARGGPGPRGGALPGGAARGGVGAARGAARGGGRRSGGRGGGGARARPGLGAQRSGGSGRTAPARSPRWSGRRGIVRGRAGSAAAAVREGTAGDRAVGG